MSDGVAGFGEGGGERIDAGETGKKTEKSFREVPKPVKSLEAAKSGALRTQQYRALRKARDWRNNFVSFWAENEGNCLAFRFARNLGSVGELMGERAKNLENRPSSKKAFFSP